MDRFPPTAKGLQAKGYKYWYPQWLSQTWISLLFQLEILGCDSLTLGYRPAEVALALLATNFQQRASLQPGHSSALMGFISELQKYCNVSPFHNCAKIIPSCLKQSSLPKRQMIILPQRISRLCPGSTQSRDPGLILHLLPWWRNLWKRLFPSDSGTEDWWKETA